MSKKIACIGTGAMGGAIMKAVCKQFNPAGIAVTDKNSEAGKKFAQENGCSFCATNKAVLDGAKYIFLAVKPQFVGDVLTEIKDSVPETAVLVSMAAGVTIDSLRSFAPKARFVRMMPNVCAKIGQAMTAVTRGACVSEAEFAEVKEILSAAGIVEEVPENLMDCVTAVSGSGPAFVFLFIESLADAAVRCGMSRAQAYIYAAQTVYGSAKMVLETKMNPAALKDMVCSPAGTTIEGVAALEKNNFRNATIEAVTAAYNRSVALGK